jgi:colicin import membrane protein
VNQFTEKIKAKIRGNVNKTLCAEGNPELRFDIGVLPSGDLAGTPKLVKSSGNSACDDAVERAIMASEPLPLPDEPSAKAKFRDLQLKFRPND